MFNLPYTLTRHFRDGAGNFDYQALLRAPDGELLALARRLPPREQTELYRQLQGLRLGWCEQLLARAAGVDVDVQRRRFLRILQQAALEARTANPGTATWHPGFDGADSYRREALPPG